MPSTFKVVALVWVVLSVRVAYAQSPGNGIRGTLRENGTPITEATVYLQSLDARSVPSFSAVRNGQPNPSRISQSPADVGTTSVDGAGTYRFHPKKSGWYVAFPEHQQKPPSGSLRKEGTRE
jgi:hypothetical protein